MPENVLSFAAMHVAAVTEEYTAGCVVHLIAFGSGDPEAGEQNWNFSRSSVEDEGVCTVREIQQATIYEGIASFCLRRTGLECVFEPQAVERVGFTGLHVTFEIDDREWARLVATARTVFRERTYFECEG